MSLGKRTRLNRLFSNPSGRLCSVAVDHFIGYGDGLPPGLRNIVPTLAEIVSARPDAVTMHKGIATAAWAPHAGRVPMILQSTIARPDDSACEQIATPEDAVRLAADAFAVAAFVRGTSEAAHLRIVADCVRQAARFEMPVICHIYPRDRDKKVSFAPEDIAWAVRCALETGVDVVKTPYCGEVAAYAQIVAECPIPVVAAGGPKAGALEAALEMIAEVVRANARGATIGRNVWGFAPVAGAVEAFKAVIHDGWSAQDAVQLAQMASPGSPA
jgi:class I fructose-bisphosphate aldolase